MLDRHGAQGQMDEASKSSLQNEFGTSDEDKCIVQILEKGDLQSTKVGNFNRILSDS